MASMEKTYYVGEFSRHFAAIIQARLTDRGVTHDHVAEYLGRTRNYVGDRLRGHKALSVDIIDAASRLLGAPSPRQFVRDVMDELGRYPEVWASRGDEVPGMVTGGRRGDPSRRDVGPRTGSGRD